MTPPIIQVEYEQMAGLSRRMHERAEACGALRQRLQQALTPLQQGGWYGRGATAFFREMESDVLPAMNRLETALTEGHLVLDEIVRIFQQAEAEAAALFQGGLTAPPVTPGSQRDRVNGAGRSGADHTDAPKTTRPAKSTAEIFNPLYMQKMVGRKWAGEGDPALRRAMDVLMQNPSPEEEKWALDIIAEKRGLDRTEIQADYEKFREYQKQIQKHPKPVEELWLPGQGSYMGSRDQLRHGEILGDALGIDAVFGAMLNPTGGMAGPGEWAIPLDESGIGYHSAFHDAGGFLYTYFGKGPGYDYLGLEPWRPRDDPLTGQQSGVLYWSALYSGRFSSNKLRNPYALFADSQLRIDFAAIVVTTGLGGYVDVTKVLPNVYDQAKQDMERWAVEEVSKFARIFLRGVA